MTAKIIAAVALLFSGETFENKQKIIQGEQKSQTDSTARHSVYSMSDYSIF